MGESTWRGRRVCRRCTDAKGSRSLSQWLADIRAIESDVLIRNHVDDDLEEFERSGRHPAARLH
jgi:hypothetical protein